VSKKESSLFTLHEHALDNAREKCPLCGSSLSIKRGKSGPFLGCDHYPGCSFTKAIVEHERVEDKILSGSECPKCAHELAVKQGRYGMFIGCSNYPQCDHIEGTQQHQSADISCPKCKKGHLAEKTSRFGKTFYSCDNYPKCKYVINYPPIEETCPECAWPILVKRQMANGEVHMCPQKKCGAKIKVNK
jgi:putative DNA topoisomerase